MPYALVIPPELVKQLYRIREKTTKSIRSQILDAINDSIDQHKAMEKRSYRAFKRADKLINKNGGEKHGTTRKDF